MSACTFFGHRDCPASMRLQVRKALQVLILEKTVNTFYVGNNGNFDRLVLEELKKLSRQYPGITYFLVLAYMPLKHSEEPEHSILPEGIETVPKRFAIIKRNMWMLEKADFVIAYVEHSWGGAAQFVHLAQHKGKTVWNLSENKTPSV